jgi:hypothetical protein
MKFREFEVEVKSHDGNEYLVLSQKKVDPITGYVSTDYITLELHQLDSLIDALLIADGN